LVESLSTREYYIKQQQKIIWLFTTGPERSGLRIFLQNVSLFSTNQLLIFSRSALYFAECVFMLSRSDRAVYASSKTNLNQIIQGANNKMEFQSMYIFHCPFPKWKLLLLSKIN
jgi:hypothetical protein